MAMRGHNTPKSSGMPAEVNVAAVRQSNVPLPGEICFERSRQKSAEAIVAEKTSWSARSHRKIAKDRTQRRAEPMRRDSTS